jgi:hypothetical protein
VLHRLPRKLHRYAGVFFAPALLFFCVTGLLQTFDLHTARAGAQPSRLILELAALHKNQTLQVPRRPPTRPEARPVAAQAERPEPAPRPAPLGEALMKLFVAGAAITLGATTLAGLYMALQARNGRPAVLALLVLGMATPIALMLLM